MCQDNLKEVNIPILLYIFLIIDIANIWKGIKNIISLKTSNQTTSNVIIDTNASLTDSITIASACNKYYISNLLLDIQKINNVLFLRYVGFFCFCEIWVHTTTFNHTGIKPVNRIR